MHIGLYFGSFNPVHTGHCIIANHMLLNAGLDQVWMIVSPHNPFKKETSLLNEYHRLFLVQLAIENEANLKGSDVEFHLTKPSYTSNTLAYLHEKYPQHDFSIIMGSDSLQNLHKWKNTKYITANHRIFVYLRPGFPVDNVVTQNITVINAPLLEISSTHIREYVRSKKSIRFLVPDKVKEEIERNGYFK